jgi:nitrogen fixation protein NifZ
MLPSYDCGDAVRLTRNVRNDGSFPGVATGTLLVRRGSTGHVVNIGTFLQDQIVYTVHFLDIDRMIGCREEELVPIDAPWTPSLFETRERVEAARHLVVGGETRAALGTTGEVLRVLRDAGEEVLYDVIFPGHVLRVPESALRMVGPRADEGKASHGP